VEKIVNSSLIKIEDLVIGFTKETPLNASPWNFEIPESELVAIIGPNGSGKTSLLRALMGEPTGLSGGVFLKEEQGPVKEWSSQKICRYFSYLPQESQFDPLQLTKHQLGLAFLPTLGFFRTKVTPLERERLEFLIKESGLDPFLNKRLQELSSGERQKVFLVRTLLQNSKIVLLDEPTNHLDPDVQETIWGLFKNEIKTRTVVVTTHDLAQVERHCDRVVALSKEGLVFAGSVSDYKSQGIKRRIFPLID